MHRPASGYLPHRNLMGSLAYTASASTAVPFTLVLHPDYYQSPVAVRSCSIPILLIGVLGVPTLQPSLSCGATALSLSEVLSAVGVSLDLGQAYRTRQSLSSLFRKKIFGPTAVWVGGFGPQRSAWDSLMTSSIIAVRSTTDEVNLVVSVVQVMKKLVLIIF